MRKALATLIIALGVSDCSGSTGSPIDARPCPVFAAVLEPLVYPANGSTGIPDMVSLLVVENFLSPTVYLTSNAGPSISSSTHIAVPSPLPTPNSALQWITSESAGSFTAFRLPPLAAATTYMVTTRAPGIDRCANVEAGWFTTQ